MPHPPHPAGASRSRMEPPAHPAARLGPAGRPRPPPPPGRRGRSGRWWWPTLAVAGFLAVVAVVLDHDHPAPGLSMRGLLIHRPGRRGRGLADHPPPRRPRALARALAEYAVVVLLAALLAATGATLDQQPATAPATPSRPRPQAATTGRRSTGRPPGWSGPWPRPAGAVAGAGQWLIDLWRQADHQTAPAHRPRPRPPPARSRSRPRIDLEDAS